jgi:hypothetical protein
MKLSIILTMTTILIVSFTAQASNLKFVQILDCKLNSHKSSTNLDAPETLKLKLTEDGNNDKLFVDGSLSSITDESLDENIDSLTFQFGNAKIQAVFTFGQCDTTRVGSVAAEAILANSKVDFSGVANLSYACKCAR